MRLTKTSVDSETVSALEKCRNLGPATWLRVIYVRQGQPL
jgi:hypothetical protein